MVQQASGDFPALRRSEADHAQEVTDSDWRTVDRRILLAVTLRILDVVAVIAAGLAAYSVCRAQFPGITLDWREIALLTVLAASLFENAGIYTVERLGRVGASALNSIGAWTLVGAMLFSVHYFLGPSPAIFSSWAATTFVIGFIFLALVRLSMAGWIAHKRKAAARVCLSVAVTGPPEAARTLARRLWPRHLHDAKLVGVFEFEPGRSDGGDAVDRLLALGRRRSLDEILVALPPEQDIAPAVRRLMSLPFNVRLVPMVKFIDVPVLECCAVLGISSLTVARPPLSSVGRAVKRAEDVVLSLIALAAFSPLMLLIVAAVRLDSRGPALFRQERWGFNGQRITVLKFRSMRCEACDDISVPQARREDSRVTRVGRILRRTSLDELPQLLNVLRGDMALVGPRPHASIHNEYYAKRIDNYLARHRIKPGITGLSQVKGYRGETPTVALMQKRVDHDLIYINNWSLHLDFKILVLTVFRGFTNPNAC
jgi:putative colanic acid biosynthesis UDP-glucose lipid carrier transferase